MICRWCRRPRQDAAFGPQAIYCSKLCRQTAFRLRRRRATIDGAREPGRFAYFDPPYPGTAKKYYGDQPTFRGEVDHRELIADAMAGGYLGWALSTSARSLRDVLPLCPPEAHVCPWVKPRGVSRDGYGLQNTWEPLIVVGGRQLQPGIRDWLRAMPARGGGDLPGRKPLAFCAFLFDALGMIPGDELVDVFPGSGAVGRAWEELSLSSSSTCDESSRGSGRRILSSVLEPRQETEPPGPRDASRTAAVDDASLVAGAGRRVMSPLQPRRDES